MLRVTVTGNTYQIRKAMLDNRFQHSEAGWVKTVNDNQLDSLVRRITPMKSMTGIKEPVISIKVEVLGNPFSPAYRFNPATLERPWEGVLDRFLIHVFHRTESHGHSKEWF